MIEPVGGVLGRDPRLLEAMQTARQTSALLSTLPGPNLGFFSAPAPPQVLAGPAATAAPTPGPGPYSPVGTRERLNVPLLEAMQTGRETSALLSGLMGPGQRVFPAPVPPAFAPAQQPAAGAGPAALPRAGVPLLEAEQQGRITSALLSGLAGPGAGAGRATPFARSAVAGDPLATMRTAQEILQSIGTAPPSLQSRQIANDAYQMEVQAQRHLDAERAAGPGRRWDWFA
jgi:hypothetical protein